MGFDEISFLAADVSSAAFNRPEPWPADRAAEIALGARSSCRCSTRRFDDAVHRDAANCSTNGFVAGGRALARSNRAVLPRARRRRRLPARAVQRAVGVGSPGAGDVAAARASFSRCTAPPAEVWTTRSIPPPRSLSAASSTSRSNETCRRCVCSLNLPLTRGFRSGRRFRGKALQIAPLPTMHRRSSAHAAASSAMALAPVPIPVQQLDRVRQSPVHSRVDRHRAIRRPVRDVARPACRSPARRQLPLRAPKHRPLHAVTTARRDRHSRERCEPLVRD